MFKRTLTAGLLGLALASHAVLAQDLKSPAFGPDSSAVRQQMSDQQKQQATQKRLDYFATHDDDAPGYPFNP